MHPTTPAETDVPIGYLKLVRRNHNFRNLWFGQIISLLGDWFNLIASASLIAQLTQSGTAIGGLFVVRMLAPFIVSPFAGIVADRYNRKHVMIVTDVARAITVCGFLLVREPGHVWLLYTLTAVQLGISGFFFPTRNAILPDVTSARELGAANALSSATWSVMLALGAAIGGVVSGAWGTSPAFIIDALTFLLSAVFISRIRYQTDPGLQTADKSVAAALQQYLDGLRYMRGHADISVIASHKAAIALLISSVTQVLQVTIAERIFVIGEGGGISLGLMYATTGIGTGIGPIIARRFTGDENRRLRYAIIVGYISGTIGLLLIGALNSFPLVLGGALLRGVGAGIIWVFSTQLLLQLLPNKVRGRVFATEFAGHTLLNATGSALAGPLGDSTLGLSGTFYGAAAFTLVPALLWTIWMSTGDLHEPAPEAGN